MFLADTEAVAKWANLLKKRRESLEKELALLEDALALAQRISDLKGKRERITDELDSLSPESIKQELADIQEGSDFIRWQYPGIDNLILPEHRV